MLPGETEKVLPGVAAATRAVIRFEPVKCGVGLYWVRSRAMMGVFMR